MPRKIRPKVSPVLSGTDGYLTRESFHTRFSATGRCVEKISTKETIMVASSLLRVLAAVGVATITSAVAPTHTLTSRRAVISGGAAVAAFGQRQRAVAAPQLRPFDWSALWQGTTDTAPKQSLTPSGVADVLRHDLADGKYILTGALTPSIFTDACHFEDPNNAVDGTAKYRRAVSLLFDPQESSLDLLSLRVGADGTTIEADYVASGTLKLPWRPRISAWSGHVVYTLNSDGLIASQVDVWNITRLDALRQTFTPGKTSSAASAAECDDACRSRIAERRALFEQSRTTSDRQKILDLSRQRAALYNTTFRGASCIPGVPCL